MKVCKFGGSSVASAEQILKVLGIIRGDESRRVVVVSAPGKRTKADEKVTDMLIACANAALAGENPAPIVEKIVGRFAEIQRDTGLPEAIVDEIRQDLLRRLSMDKRHAGKFMDAMKAAGEDLSARIVAAIFTAKGLPSAYVDLKAAGMVLTDEFGNAQLLPESYENLRRALSGMKEIAIVPGFFGYTKGGDIATFPRGGSDITGSILAAALKADVYENFTDVDNVYPIDPRIIPEVKEGIKEMTYREMRELAYAGFGVFHDEAILPAVRANIPINIRNTNRPELPGTMVLPKRDYDRCAVLGIASDDGFVQLYVDKYMMNREVGFGRRLLQILEDEGISWEHIPTGIDNVSVVLRDARFTPEQEARVVARIDAELAPDNILVERGHAIIMVVGEGMQYAVGMAARATGALAAAGVNIEMLNQGASEISMMFGVKGADRPAALRALYAEFF
ncbi:MAG: aspartate kinase [Kiritimatiellaeota bacterium]|nr:aspartate kinase [Kiritimatiellota bacterium]